LFALKNLGQGHANCEKDNERNQSGSGDVISADAKQGLGEVLQPSTL
jgi:hypothetical protein